MHMHVVVKIQHEHIVSWSWNELGASKIRHYA